MRLSPLQLPNETLARIAQLRQLQDDRYFERVDQIPDGHEISTVLDFGSNFGASLHELSRTCRRMRDICAPLIFSTINLRKVYESTFRRRIVPHHAAHFRKVKLGRFEESDYHLVADALVVASGLVNIRQVEIDCHFLEHICPLNRSLSSWLSSNEDAATATRDLIRRAQNLTIDGTFGGKRYFDVLTLIDVLTLSSNLRSLTLHSDSSLTRSTTQHFCLQFASLHSLSHLSLDGSWPDHLSEHPHPAVGSLRYLTLRKRGTLTRINVEYIALFSSTLEKFAITIDGDWDDDFEKISLFTQRFPRLRFLHLNNAATHLLSSSSQYLPSLRALHITTACHLIDKLFPKLRQFLYRLPWIETIELDSLSSERYSTIFTRSEFLGEYLEYWHLKFEDYEWGTSVLFSENSDTDKEEKGGASYIRTVKAPLEDVLRHALVSVQAVAETMDVQKMERLVRASKLLCVLKEFEED